MISMISGDEDARAEKSVDPLEATWLNIYVGWFHPTKSMIRGFSLVSLCQIRAFKLVYKKQETLSFRISYCSLDMWQI